MYENGRRTLGRGRGRLGGAEYRGGVSLERRLPVDESL